MERSDSSNSAAKTRQSEIRQILAILHKWGIHTIGQLAALDKQQLGARLRPEAIRMLERANGQSSRVIKLVRPAESFEESFEFENEIETAEPLLFMLRRFGAARRAAARDLSRRKRTDAANHVCGSATGPHTGRIRCGGQTSLRTRFQNPAANQRCRSSLPHAPDAPGEFSIGTSDRCGRAQCAAD